MTGQHPEDLDEQCGIMTKLFFSTLVRLRFSSVLERHAIKLTASQMTLLYAIYEAPERRLSAGRLAEELGVSAPAITGLADKLHRDDFLTKLPGQEDRRVVILALTESGKAAVEEMIDAFEELFLPLLFEMSPDSRQSLLRGMEHIHALARHITGQPVGVRSD
ncbi:MAG: MarR family transcriptional regulator [Dehalococcoidia bacterium]|nr:MarR family transcriptional regulator [Dehalococcoidia bacterium]